MKRLLKASFIVLLAIALSISPSTMKTNAKKKDSGKELVILENVPEVEAEVVNGEIQLQALNVYEDGHFKTTSDNLRWNSKNRTVAFVDEDGTVSLTGQNGRTWISVTDGQSQDEIGIHVKTAKRKSSKRKAKNIISSTMPFKG